MIANDFYVYEHWRPDTGKCFYVGKGRGRRSVVMYNRNRHHKAIQSKLEELGLRVDIVIAKRGLTEDEAIALEIETIASYGMSNLANLTSGGDGLKGKFVSEETRVLMSSVHKGHCPSAETRRKISESHKGRPKASRSKDWRAAQSKAKRGKPLTPEHLEAVRAAAKRRTGIKRGPMSEECKAKISASKTGRKRGPFTADHKKRMSESIKLALARKNPKED